jgi:DNA replication protein DnaC
MPCFSAHILGISLIYSGPLSTRIVPGFYARASLLVIDEISFLPIPPVGANLFFQLVNARYEKGAMILTSNCGFAEWGEIFGDPVVATALLDRLLHHAVVVQIEGAVTAFGITRI